METKKILINKKESNIIVKIDNNIKNNTILFDKSLENTLELSVIDSNMNLDKTIEMKLEDYYD